MYRVVVYRTNDLKEDLCYCCSRKFESLEWAQHFANRQNQKPNRLAKIAKQI